jgi:hypothetical protein
MLPSNKLLQLVHGSSNFSGMCSTAVLQSNTSIQAATAL